MGVNGIYGLSGSGLDIESMVKVGMMSKQKQYDKMQQTYTKNEWTKAAWVDLYGKVQSFNNSTLSKYKMSANMNARGTQSSESTIKATANANAASMTHYVTVGNAATNAYIISDKKPERLNGETSSARVASMLFESINASGNSVYYKETATGETKSADYNAVAFKFAVGDGVTGSMTNSDDSVASVKATASASAINSYYTVDITQLADNVSLTSKSIGSIKHYDTTAATNTTVTTSSTSTGLKEMIFTNVSVDTGTGEVTTFNPASKTGSNSESKIAATDLENTNALQFTLSDGKKSAQISLTYEDILTNGATLETLAEKINTAGLNITASYEDGKFSLTNKEVGSANTISITIPSNDGDNKIGSNTSHFLNNLGLTDSISGDTQTYSSGSTKAVSGQDAAGKIDDKTITFKGNTAFAEGFEITANKVGKTNISFAPQFVAVTYGQLADGYSMNDLASDINSLGLNVKASYDSVNDKFSIFNKESGADNKIDLYMPYSGSEGDDAGIMTTKFFNSWGFKQSENGELTNDVTFSVSSGVEIKGANASVKVDGANYEVSDNKVTVAGVTYDFTGAKAGTTGTVVVTQDTDKIIENVKSFVEDYNKLLKELTDVYNEKPNKNYKPLTDSQREQMKDEQIEKWEEKAKAGLLYHDQTLGKLIDEMRSAVSTKVMGISGSYDSVFSLGISTTGTKGQLSLDEDKLKTALSKDPDSVYNVFAALDKGHTYTTASGKKVTLTDRAEYNGVAQRLGDVFIKNMKSMKSVGGTDLSTNDDSDLSKLMRELQTKMSNFKRLMQSFEDKLYKKYDKMETTLAGMGVQLNYVTMAFS